MREARHRRCDVRTGLRTVVRHRDARVPFQDLLGVGEIRDLRQDGLQPLELRRFGRDRQTACGASFSRRYRTYGFASMGLPVTRSIVSCGVNLRPEPIQVLAQPLAQLAELTLLEALVEIAQVFLRPIPDLHRDHVAERVGREIAEPPAGPVHVLKHAVRVVGNVDSRDIPPSARSRLPADLRRRSVPSIRSCSSSKRRMMCRL